MQFRITLGVVHQLPHHEQAPTNRLAAKLHGQHDCTEDQVTHGETERDLVPPWPLAVRDGGPEPQSEDAQHRVGRNHNAPKAVDLAVEEPLIKWKRDPLCSAEDEQGLQHHQQCNAHLPFESLMPFNVAAKTQWRPVFCWFAGAISFCSPSNPCRGSCQCFSCAWNHLQDQRWRLNLARPLLCLSFLGQNRLGSCMALDGCALCKPHLIQTFQLRNCFCFRREGLLPSSAASSPPRTEAKASDAPCPTCSTAGGNMGS